MQPTEVRSVAEPPDPAACPPEDSEKKMPLDIILSPLRPDELEKLTRYIASYAKLCGHAEQNR